MLRAVLMHPEARRSSATDGKVREPVLKLSAYLRAFGYTSDSGNWRVGNTDSAGSALGQTPMRSPSVFNFYRPGYVPASTAIAARIGFSFMRASSLVQVVKVVFPPPREGSRASPHRPPLVTRRARPRQRASPTKSGTCASATMATAAP